jgi:hypothetical protein
MKMRGGVKYEYRCGQEMNGDKKEFWFKNIEDNKRWGAKCPPSELAAI